MNLHCLSDKFLEEVKNIRRELHQYPELEFDLPKTTSIIKRELKKLNIDFESDIAGGIVALIKGEKKDSSKTILLRADMDALPLQEENKIDFISKHENKMHACGHDGHIANLLGVAMILNSIKNEFAGNVKLLFQAAEENPGGAKPMIEKGVLENPKVDMAFAFHLWPELYFSKIGIKYGAMMAKISEFKIKINAKGGHASQPENTIDPIMIGVQAIQTMQNIISRNKSPFDLAVLSITFINAGSAYNIIPEVLEFGGTIRSFSDKTTNLILERIKNIMNGLSVMHGISYDIDIVHYYPELINDEKATNILKNSVIKYLGESYLSELKNPVMGAEDFSYFSKEVPSSFFFLGSGEGTLNERALLHNSKFNFNEDVLKYSMITMSGAVLDALEELNK